MTSTAHPFEIPSQTIISPSLNPSIQKNIDDWINQKSRDFQLLCKKLHARYHTYNRFLQHQQQQTLPPDLNIKFEGYNQYPLSIEMSQRESLKQKETDIFHTAMKAILNQRIDAYKLDIDNLESQITTAMNNTMILQIVSQELPFVNSNNTLRDNICFQLSALYTATRQQHITLANQQRTTDSSLNQSSNMDESYNNNAKSDEHIASLIRSVLKEELKHMLKPSAPSPKKQNSNFKEHHPNHSKNESERGRGNTPRRNGNGNHVRRSRSDSSHRSKSTSSTNNNRVTFTTQSNSNSSPRGRNHAPSNKQDNRNRQRSNHSTSPQPRTNYSNSNNNNYYRQRNQQQSSPPPPRYHKRN